eukprot:gene28547-34459_t
MASFDLDFLDTLFSDHVLASVLKELFQLSLYSTYSTEQRATALSSEVQKRVKYLSPYLQVQRSATEDEALGFLELLGVELSPASMATLQDIMHLCKHPSVLLTLGGDDRLVLTDGRRNKYLSTPFVSALEVQHGSCTCSSLSSRGFAAAAAGLQAFLQAVGRTGLSAQQALHEHDESVRRGLRELLGLEEKALEVLLFPSGTDAEFLPLAVALVRSRHLCRQQSTHLDGANASSADAGEEARVLSVVYAAGEVGSGTALASGGRHFSPLCPDAAPAVSGSPLEGLARGAMVEVLQIAPRDPSSGLVRAHDQSDLRARLEQDPCLVCVVHVVAGSKTGLLLPRIDAFSELQEAFPQRVLLVVDACQLRCRLQALQKYAARGACVLFTGSKFFGAPPFCGAAVLSKVDAALLEAYLEEQGRGGEDSAEADGLLPVQGLARFLGSAELPACMPRLRARLERWQLKLRGAELRNLGLGLRWAAALDSMTAYHCAPAAFLLAVTRGYLDAVRALLADAAPYLIEMRDEGVAFRENVADLNSIVSLRLFRRGAGGAVHELSLSQLREVHARMLLPLEEASGSIRRVSALLGQPVKVRDAEAAGGDAKTERGVLRIALGASLVLDLLDAFQRSHANTDWKARGGFAVGIRDAVQLAFAAHRKRALRTRSCPFESSDAFQDALSALLLQDELVLHKLLLLARDWDHFSSSKSSAATISAATEGSLADPFDPVLRAVLRANLMHPPLYPSVSAGPIASSREVLRFPVEQLPGIIRKVWSGDSPSLSRETPGVQRQTQESRAREESPLPWRTDTPPDSPAATARHMPREEDSLPPACPASAPLSLSAPCLVYSLDALDATWRDLEQSFQEALGETFEMLHCFALKACPCTGLLAYMLRPGRGCEAASANEAAQALRVLRAKGLGAGYVLYDSPCKPARDLEFALTHGLTVNLNSLAEVEEVAFLLQRMLKDQGTRNFSGRVGLRVNPLVGEGGVAALSVSTASSKFGLPLLSARALGGLAALPRYPLAEGREEDRAALLALLLQDDAAAEGQRGAWGGLLSLLRLFQRFPFLTGLMMHVGSGAMSRSALVEGAGRLFLLTQLVDLLREGHLQLQGEANDVHENFCHGLYAGAFRGRGVDFLDVGGGLSVDACSLSVCEDSIFRGYAQELKKVRVHVLLNEEQLLALPSNSIVSYRADRGPPPAARRKLLVTEFGKALICRAGVALSPVHDVLSYSADAQSGGYAEVVAVAGMGADLFLRTAYAPDSFPLLLSLLDGVSHQPLHVRSGDGANGKSEGAGRGLFCALPSSSPVLRDAVSLTVAGPLCFAGDVLMRRETGPLPHRGDVLVALNAGANALSLFSRHCSRASPAVFAVRVCGAECQVTRVRDEETCEEVLRFWD